MNHVPEIFCFTNFLLAYWESRLELHWLFACSCFSSGTGSTGLQLNSWCILLLSPTKSYAVTGDRGTRKEPDIPEPVLLWVLKIPTFGCDFTGYLGHTLYLPNVLSPSFCSGIIGYFFSCLEKQGVVPVSSPTGKLSSSLMASEWSRLVWSSENTTETMQKERAEIPHLPWSIISWKPAGFCHLSPVSPLLFGDPFLSPSSSMSADTHKQLNSSTQRSGDSSRAGPGTRDLPRAAPQPWPVSPKPVLSQPNHYPQQLNGQTLTTCFPLQVSLIFPGATNPRTE